MNPGLTLAKSQPPAMLTLSYGSQDLRNHLRTRWAFGKTTRPVVMGDSERKEKHPGPPETMVIHMGISWLWEYRG